MIASREATAHPLNPAVAGCPSPAQTRSADVTLRRSHYTRGRLEKESPIDDDSTDEQLCRELLRMFNGDWSQPTIVHYCFEPNCCSGGQLGAARQRIVALLTAALVDRLGEKLPSTHRWHTISPALTTQVGPDSRTREQMGPPSARTLVRTLWAHVCGRDNGFVLVDNFSDCFRHPRIPASFQFAGLLWPIDFACSH